MAFKLTCKPCSYKRISQYFKKSSHKGIDLVNSKGTKIRAAAAGTVVAAGWSPWDSKNRSYGYQVAIYHGNGNYTNYAHMNKKLKVKVGKKVKSGTVIGLMDSTGNSTGVHLHFEVHKGKKWNRVDPLPYIKKIK